MATGKAPKTKNDSPNPKKESCKNIKDLQGKDWWRSDVGLIDGRKGTGYGKTRDEALHDGYKNAKKN
jgi:hypothetical protein